MPKPDLAVVEPGDPTSHPEAALLVIEISMSSFTIDTRVKPSIYASIDVPNYWVVDVVRRRVIVHRDPEADGYATQTLHRPPEALQPLEVDVPPLDLAQLFR